MRKQNFPLLCQKDRFHELFSEVYFKGSSEFTFWLNLTKFEILLDRSRWLMEFTHYINNSLYLAPFSARKTVSFEEQMMSKDKYPRIFSPQLKAIVFLILQIFFATRSVLKIGEYLTIIPWACVGYELAITNLVSNKREWNNCFIKNAPKI